jgi:hypothetical protein
LQEADRLEPVRVKKTRYIWNPEPRFDSIETEMLWESGARKVAYGHRPAEHVQHCRMHWSRIVINAAHAAG